MEEMGWSRMVKQAMSRSRHDGDGDTPRLGLGADLIISCGIVIIRVAALLPGRKRSIIMLTRH